MAEAGTRTILGACLPTSLGATVARPVAICGVLGGIPFTPPRFVRFLRRVFFPPTDRDFPVRVVLLFRVVRVVRLVVARARLAPPVLVTDVFRAFLNGIYNIVRKSLNGHSLRRRLHPISGVFSTRSHKAPPGRRDQSNSVVRCWCLSSSPTARTGIRDGRHRCWILSSASSWGAAHPVRSDTPPHTFPHMPESQSPRRQVGWADRQHRVDRMTGTPSRYGRSGARCVREGPVGAPIPGNSTSPSWVD